MFNTASLSLDQAPPISVPFRFFLTAPVFGVLAALLIIFSGPEMLLSRWMPRVLGLTHLLTLGFLTMVMFGAMMQMLPVLAGSPLPQVKRVGPVVHLLLLAGTLLLVAGFVFNVKIWLAGSLVLLGVSVLLFLSAAAVALWRIKYPTPTTIGMLLALIALAVTLILGLMMGMGHIGKPFFSGLYQLTDLHVAWSLLGWVGLLVVGVSYQVVPMFQVTPEYPVWIRRYWASLLFACLLSITLFSLVPSVGDVANYLLIAVLTFVGAAYLTYAIWTLLLQHRRKRRVKDATLQFWRIGMISICLVFILWVCGQMVIPLRNSSTYPLLMGGGLIFGVAISLINGMLYKIVSFLSWFHLQHRQLSSGDFSQKLPHMKSFISDRWIRAQLYLHLGALLLLPLAIGWPELFLYSFSLIFGVSNILLFINLVSAMLRYGEIAKRFG
ncbi:MAG: hypothetical protein GY934_13990 [Gammaproteobacteria bacterium]|nr:hypothetical protein [Gammaproteobacteria bacterium]